MENKIININQRIQTRGEVKSLIRMVMETWKIKIVKIIDFKMMELNLTIKEMEEWKQKQIKTLKSFNNLL